MISDDLTQEIQRIDLQAMREFIDRKWDDEILPALTDYIAVSAKSPMFDLDWAHNGFIETSLRTLRNGPSGNLYAA